MEMDWLQRIDDHTVIVDGIPVSRELFKYFQSTAEEGGLFRLAKAGGDNKPVVVETLRSVLSGSLPRGQSDWIQTYTGRQFWPLDPRPDEVFIEDIAHALSNMCRYTGHVREFYSVAEHSVRASIIAERRIKFSPPPCHEKPQAEWCDRKGPSDFMGHTCYPDWRTMALWALLHDAPEAYIVDLPRPLKRSPVFGEIYKVFEHKLMGVICTRFGLEEQEPPLVKEIDNVLLMTERRDLMNRPPQPWRDIATPDPEIIHPWLPQIAESRFLARFEDLTN